MEFDSMFGFYKGRLEVLGDVISPIYSDEQLDEFEAGAFGVFRPQPAGEEEQP